MVSAARLRSQGHMLEINPADLSAIGELYVPLEHVCDGFQEQWDNCPGLHASFANTSWLDASILSSAGRVLWRSRGMWSLRAFTSESRALASGCCTACSCQRGRVQRMSELDFLQAAGLYHGRLDAVAAPRGLHRAAAPASRSRGAR